MLEGLGVSRLSIDGESGVVGGSDYLVGRRSWSPRGFGVN